MLKPRAFLCQPPRPADLGCSLAAVAVFGNAATGGLLRCAPTRITAVAWQLYPYLEMPEDCCAARRAYDYTKGKLAELIEVIIEEKTALFVCAIGVPPKHAVDRLHQAGIPIMNMAGEGGGHTGDISASILIPACVDAVKGHMSPLNGKPVYVVGAGAVCDGRGLAANLIFGNGRDAHFVRAVEASAPPKHKKFIVSAGFEDAFTTLIFTGRALRVRRTDYIDNWNNNRQAEIKELTSKGILPHEAELEKHPSLETRSWLMGRVSSVPSLLFPLFVHLAN
ncbi:hypothetical protein FB451DRAFT_1551421 [Mycena latifolia]|nr:hypothetical protein FB451DRAFT_1551421 [Mycena latifolia]